MTKRYIHTTSECISLKKRLVLKNNQFTFFSLFSLTLNFFKLNS